MVGLDSGCPVKKGDIIVIATADISTTTIGGLGYPGGPVSNADWTTDGRAAGDQFAGVAIESLTADATYSPTTGFIVGSNCVRVATKGVHEFTCTGLARADIGAPAYADAAVNPQRATKTLGTAKNAPIGIITWVNLVSSATLCRVKIDGYAMGAGGVAGT